MSPDDPVGPAKLAIIACMGEMPRDIIRACRASGRPFYVAAIRGACEPATVEGVPHDWFDLVEVGRLLNAMRRQGCEEVTLAGPMARPEFRSLVPRDLKGAALLRRLLGARGQGDDALLRTVLDYFQEQGFRPVGTDAVAGGLLAAEGALGRHRPDAAAERDIALGIRAVGAIGALDIGQAAVVRGGRVLALEAAEGTDAMLERCAVLAVDGPAGDRNDRLEGVLVKMPKPGQEARADLPAIGPRTVAGAARARLAGIAIAAGATLVFDRDRTRADADAGGLFVHGFRL
ncbi:LpxI family protein [Marinibaculum pumilum]|uniref:LpxI family protein n=1 Tax=Marinibaculum pumilum TaxID=1766165 RepID=A0ABV7KUD9_9PROT